jgi:hypothetical protein
MPPGRAERSASPVGKCYERSQRSKQQARYQDEWDKVTHIALGQTRRKADQNETAEIDDGGVCRCSDPADKPDNSVHGAGSEPTLLAPACYQHCIRRKSPASPILGARADQSPASRDRHSPLADRTRSRVVSEDGRHRWRRDASRGCSRCMGSGQRNPRRHPAHFVGALAHRPVLRPHESCFFLAFKDRASGILGTPSGSRK